MWCSGVLYHTVLSVIGLFVSLSGFLFSPASHRAALMTHCEANTQCDLSDCWNIRPTAHFAWCLLLYFIKNVVRGSALYFRLGAVPPLQNAARNLGVYVNFLKVIWLTIEQPFIWSTKMTAHIPLRMDNVRSSSYYYLTKRNCSDHGRLAARNNFWTCREHKIHETVRLNLSATSVKGKEKHFSLKAE